MAERDQDFSEYDESSDDYSDDEQNEQEYETFTGVMGYQYEPKRPPGNADPDEQTDKTEQKSTAIASGHGDRPSRLGNTDWFVIFHVY